MEKKEKVKIEIEQVGLMIRDKITGEKHVFTITQIKPKIMEVEHG